MHRGAAMAIAVCGGLAVGILPVSLLVAIWSGLDAGGWGYAFDLVWFFCIFALLFGGLPALLIGAPTYLLLHRRGLTSYPMMLLLGLIFGAIAAAYDISMGGYFLLYGSAVACGTHFVAVRMRAFRPVAVVPLEPVAGGGK